MRLAATLAGVDRALGDLLAALDQELEAAAVRGAEFVADDARATHTFTNRTDELEGHIVPGGVRGLFSAGTLEVDVVGDTPYGGFVDEGTARSRAYPFLAPAFAHQEDALVRELEAGLAAAAHRAGWAT